MTPEPVNPPAPEPPAPAIPTRRVFVFAGGAFVLGAAIGGAGGYSTAVLRADGDRDGGGDAAPSELELPEPSGDPDLDELRRLALVAPIEELAKEWIYFLDVFAVSYRHDRYLPQGVIRLADYVESHVDCDQRMMRALVLKDTINRGELHLRERCGYLVPMLLRIR